MSEIRDIPQGHWDLFLAWHELLALPRSFPPCRMLCTAVRYLILRHSCHLVSWVPSPVQPPIGLIPTPYSPHLSSPISPACSKHHHLLRLSQLSGHIWRRNGSFSPQDGSLVSVLFHLAPFVPHTHSVERIAACGENLLK